MTSASTTIVTLLWPLGHKVVGKKSLASDIETDLGLAAIVAALDLDGRHNRFIAEVLAGLSMDAEVISYRQAILADLLRLPTLAKNLTELLPQLGRLAGFARALSWGDTSSLLQLTSRLVELEYYVECVEKLWLIIEASSDLIEAEGLLALRTLLAATRAEEIYQNLAVELPLLRSQLEQAGSVTIGINLDGQFRPEAATLVSINQGRFAGKGNLLERLLGDWANSNAVRGITPLFKAEEGQSVTPEHELFRDLNDLLERITAPVVDGLAKYTRLNSAPLALLEPELTFYLGAVKLTEQLQATGFALCQPEIAPIEEQAGTISGLYNLDLVLRLRNMRAKDKPDGNVVANDIAFGADAQIFILTGPNSGGKTTFIRAVGQAQVLFQAGLLVPGQAARLSPVDVVYTHFAVAERLSSTGGRLAEELERLALIFKVASRSSLVLLNEPLASTDHISARALSRELLAGLRLLSSRAIYVTHLHELVADSVTLTDSSHGATVVSLVAGVTANESADATPNYTIKRGLPGVSGYASELARQHGLSLAQIVQSLQERGLLD